MTLRMYAKRKTWPLNDVKIELTHQKVDAKSCDNCPQTSGTIDLIEKSIELIGDLDSSQRTRLLEIAGKCPVHKTLSAGVTIRTQQ